MRRLFHSVILSSDEVIPFSFRRSLRFALRHRIGRAVANKTVDEVSRPISGSAGDALFLVRANEFSPDRCSLSRSRSLSLSLSFYFILFYSIFHGGKRLRCTSAGFCRTRSRARARAIVPA